VGGQQGGKQPTDRGKIGTNRRVRTDGGGVPLGLAGEGANRHDCTMVAATRMRIPLARPTPTPAPPQRLCLDKGDASDEVRARLAACGVTAHIWARGAEAKALPRAAGFTARRGGVERTQSGLQRFRRVLIRWDTHVRNALAFLQMAWASMTYKHAGLLG
jgi:putative transposase